jgi:hypothetical protein
MARIQSFAWAWAVALLASTGGADAQETPATTAYLITVAGGSASGNVIAHEVMSIERAGDASRVAVASADGTIVSQPVRFTSDGQIASRSQDAGVTCYNMAMDVVAHAHAPTSAPATVFLRFANSVVAVPLDVRSTQTQGNVRTTALQGVSKGIFSTADTALDAGIVVNAVVAQTGNDLRSASFDEIQYIGTPDRVVGRSTCVLTRARAPHGQAART